MKLNLIHISLLLYLFLCYNSIYLPKNQEVFINNIRPNDFYYLTFSNYEYKDLEIQIKFPISANNTGNPFQFYFLPGHIPDYKTLWPWPSKCYENNNYMIVKCSYSFRTYNNSNIEFGFISNSSIENATFLSIDTYVDTNHKFDIFKMLVIIIVIFAFLYILIQYRKKFFNCFSIPNQNGQLLPQVVQP